jgi:hypothetical protein
MMMREMGLPGGVGRSMSRPAAMALFVNAGRLFGLLVAVGVFVLLDGRSFLGFARRVGKGRRADREADRRGGRGKKRQQTATHHQPVPEQVPP